MWKPASVSGSKLPFSKQKGLIFTIRAREAVEKSWKSLQGRKEKSLHGNQGKDFPVNHGWENNPNGFNTPCRHSYWVHSNNTVHSWRSLLCKPNTFSWVTDRCFKRCLTTQGEVEDQENEMVGSESDEISSELEGFSENEDLSDENVGLEKSPIEDGDLEVRDNEDEDLSDDLRTDSAADDQFMAGNLLDLATNEVGKLSGDRGQRLWFRVQQAETDESYSFKAVISSWVAEGKPVSHAEVILTITILRKQLKYKRALEVSYWILTEKPFDLTDMDYAICLDLIAKVHGVQKAVDYFATIPKAFQTAMAYSTLLTVYVENNMEREAVGLVQKAEKLGLGQRTFMHNKLLHVYRKNGKMKRVDELLKVMDEKKIEPDVYTYNIILDIRAKRGDAAGMEKWWKRIENDKQVSPNAATYCILARGYVVAGLLDKAEKATKQAEISPFRRKRLVYRMLLKLYAQLGKSDELERIWGLLTNGFKIIMGEYIIMIESLGKVGKVERAEEIFEKMIDKLGTKRLKQFNALLSVYSNQGMLEKAEDLVQKISKTSFRPNPSTYHQLIKMYVKAGKEEKAKQTLLKAQKENRTSVRNVPWYTSFQVLLEMYAEKGDVQNAEKVIKSLKNAGYSCSFRSYCTLLKAYTKAEITPYGFLDRLRGDGAIPNAYIRSELEKINKS